MNIIRIIKQYDITSQQPHDLNISLQYITLYTSNTPKSLISTRISMNNSNAMQLANRLKSTLLSVAHITMHKIHQALQLLKQKATYLWKIVFDCYGMYPYATVGIATCVASVAFCYTLARFIRKNRNTKNKQKPAYTDQQSTYPSLDSIGPKSDDSFMSIKLPMDAIIETDNQDDGQDRLFFQVYRRYRRS